MLNIKQIAVASDTENGVTLYALTDDGKLYERVGRYFCARHDKDGKTVVQKAYTVHWWKLVPCLTSDPGDIGPEAV